MGFLRPFVRVVLSLALSGLASSSGVLAEGQEAMPFSAGSQPAAMPFAQRTLSNGLHVAVVEDHAVPVVQVAMWYRFGAVDERQGHTGLAHALAHMMYRGTPSLSGLGLDDMIAHLGARATATTSNDYTHYEFIAPADKLALLLRLESERMQQLLITEPDWKYEKEVVLDEYDRDLEQPVAKLYDRVCREASSARLCSLAALGDRKDVAAATTRDLRSVYDAWYAPNDASLVITGDVRSSAAFAYAQRYFGAIPGRALPDRNNASVRYEVDRSVQVTGNFPYQLLDIAYPAPGTLDDGAGALHLVDAVIRNPRSPFYKSLVASGLTLGYSTQYDQNRYGGLYHVFLIVAPDHLAAEARDAFYETLREQERGGFPNELVNAAKTAAAAQALYARDSVDGLGERVGYALGVEGSTDPARADEKIAATSARDVTATAQRFLDVPAVVGILQPTGSAAASSAAPPTGVVDDFSRRAPDGPILEARWVQQALQTPPATESKVWPAAFVLSNGVHVFVQRIRANHTVFINGNVETSPRSDPDGKEGLGAMVSSMLGYGSFHYDFEAQRKAADDVGATIDFGFSFGAHGSARDLSRLVDVLADDLQRPSFPASYVEVVRKQTLAAIAERDHDPEYLSGRGFEELLLKPEDATLREPVPASIKGISRDDLRRYAAQYVRPDVTTISVVGDVDPQETAHLLERELANWRSIGQRPNLEPEPIPYPQPAKRFIFTDRELDDAHLGAPASARGSNDYYALNLINAILGADGDYDTRLMTELYTRHALVDSVSSSLDADKYRGIWNFRLSADPSKLNEAVDMLKYELGRFQDDPVGLYELNRAKTKLVARALVSEESTAVIAERVQDIGFNGLPTDESVKMAARYGRITPADLIRVAKGFILPNDLIEVYEGPRP
ncbi:MAG: M16 family metallopeptidase [Vulcanimicrobiaceae bacterium]